MKRLIMILSCVSLLSFTATAQVRIAIERNWDAKSFRRAVKKERNIDAIDRNGQSYLHLAADLNRAQHIPILLTRISEMLKKRDASGVTPIEIAIMKGNLSAFLALMPRYDAKRYRTQNKYEWTLVHWAARFDQPAMLKELRSLGADINAPDKSKEPWTPLDLAINSGSESAANTLLAMGAIRAQRQ